MLPKLNIYTSDLCIMI